MGFRLRLNHHATMPSPAHAGDFRIASITGAADARLWISSCVLASEVAKRNRETSVGEAMLYNLLTFVSKTERCRIAPTDQVIIQDNYKIT